MPGVLRLGSRIKLCRGSEAVTFGPAYGSRRSKEQRGYLGLELSRVNRVYYFALFYQHWGERRASNFGL